MTVIRSPPQHFPSIGYPNSENNSDTESYLGAGSVSASDTESLNNEPVFRPRPVIRPQQVEESITKKSFGRKKLRRYQNRKILQTLNEEDEEENGTVPIMEPYQAPFTRLMADYDALAYWNQFIDKPEEEQVKILENYSQTIKLKTSNVENTPKNDKSMVWISSKIKKSIKVKENLCIEFVKNSEDEIIDFFKATPDKKYLKVPKNRLERLLLHAIAHYHGLESLSLCENGCRIVSVQNSLSDWVPAECFLTDFTTQLKN